MILNVDCGSWIACKIKDSCKRSTLVCYISVSICKIAPKHLVNRVLERHCLESYELDFWSSDALHNFIEGIFDDFDDFIYVFLIDFILRKTFQMIGTQDHEIYL